jgi:hypothetical protein
MTVRLFLLIILYVFAISNFACYSLKPGKNCGSVLLKHRMLNLQTGEFVLPAFERDRKVWYMDSLVIGEGAHVDIENDKNGKLIWKTYVGEYTFIDLRTKSYYEYLTFSDTAKIVDSYSEAKEGGNKRGWKFFSTTILFPPEKTGNLSDTVIDKISYKRIKTIDSVSVPNLKGQNGIDSTQIQIRIGYLRCDLPILIFSMDKNVEKRSGCQVVRFDQIAPSNQSVISTQIEFLIQSLTNEEIKVFGAWKKNLAKYPIKNN